ncbi:MAG: HD domain-containing protein [Gemmatimonadota bacterium]
MPTRDEALKLMQSWVDDAGLRKHMLAVEAAVRWYARRYGADEELWGLAGLLHDLDWEKYPDEHPHRGVIQLRADGYPEEVIDAVLAHAYPDRSDVEPVTDLQKVLCACDELSGLVYACCLVRPNGIDDLTPKSVVKKLKDKAFAAGVSREEVARGMELIGMERSEHIQNVIDGLKTVAADLGIRAQDLTRA